MHADFIQSPKEIKWLFLEVSHITTPDRQEAPSKEDQYLHNKVY
jgi:hypothetical protein